MRTTNRAVVAAVAVGAVAIRLPAYLATRHLSFDDGVYGASAVAMRHGGLPFRDVFSSQGPLFLPLVWLADLLGLRSSDAPRLLALASAVGLVAATWWAARGLRLSVPAATVAALLVATSGSVLWVTGPLTSDGPSLALATAAVAAALSYRRRPNLARALLIGGLMGATLSIKSLLVAAAVPVGLVLLRDRRHLAAAVGVAAAISLAVALPWGLDNVWDQAFDYHLDAAGARTPVANLRKVASTLGDRDLPLATAAVAALAGWALARRRPGRRVPPEPGRPAGEARTEGPSGSPTGTVGDPLGLRLIAAWLAATVLVLAAEHPLWRNHVAHLVPAVALLVAAAFDQLGAQLRPPRPAVIAAVVLALFAVPYHLIHMSDVLWPAPPGRALTAARADLARLPPGAWAISDDPGVVWRAGRRTPDDLVDASILRIESGRLTAASVARAASDDRVCGVLVWSHRFANLTDLSGLLRNAGYSAGPGYGGVKTLWIRADCGAPGADSG